MTALPPALLLELSAAALAVRHRLGRRRSWRIEAAVNGVLAALRRLDLTEDLAVPPAAVALDQLRVAVQIAKAAGVAWPDVIAVINGEED